MKIHILAVLGFFSVLHGIGHVLANDCHKPPRRYYQQVPHVVLPQTIEYHPSAKSPSTGRMASGGGRNCYPATYTAYPSYESDEEMRFRTINQVSYPVTPESPTWSTPEQAAEYWQNHQVQVQKPAWVKEPEKENLPAPQQVPQFQPAIPTNIGPQDESSPDFQNQAATDKKWIAPQKSLIFVKSQRENGDPDHEEPQQLLKSSIAKRTVNPIWETDWWMNAGDFELALQVSYNQPTPPTANTPAAALGANVPDYSAILQQFQTQQAQAAPAYAGGCMTYGNGPCMGGGMMRRGNAYPAYCCQQPSPTYSPQVIQDAWNAYFSAYNSRPFGVTPVSGMTQQMPQTGMPGMPGVPNYGYMAFNPAANNAQPSTLPMPQTQNPQTVGYIVLYPNQNQDGTSDGNANGSDPQQNMKAVFVPFDSQQGMNIQSAMNTQMQQGMMNPYMNPYANPYMNPMAMGMMNPCMMNPMMGMMNPWMMGMGQPQIIIQIPQQTGRDRQGDRQGLFARRRQQRAVSDSSGTTSAHASVCNDGSYSHFRVPAKAAYPYGYFGAQTEPFTTGNFGGYGDTKFSKVTYPGF